MSAVLADLHQTLAPSTYYQTSIQLGTPGSNLLQLTFLLSVLSSDCGQIYILYYIQIICKYVDRFLLGSALFNTPKK